MHKKLDRLVSSFLLYLLLISISTNLAFATPSCDLAKQVFPVVQKIRGLNFNGQVKCELHDKNQVLKFVTSEISKEEVSKKAKNVELVLQSLKVIPKNFDYQKQMIALYTSQIGGYYDPKSKKYVMASWMPDFVQPTVASHELTHALQDKYFDLQKILDEKKFSSDQILARSALIEGDATMTMYDYMGSIMGQPALREKPSVEPYILQTVMGMYVTGNTSTVPKLIISTLIFPYTSGFRFAHYLARNGNGYESIDKALKNPPTSTREILFPDQYIKRIKNPELESNRKLTLEKFKSIALSKNSDDKVSDSLGSFFLSNWLSSLSIDATTSNLYASRLLMDEVIINSNKTVNWKILLDTELDTQNFYKKICPQIIQNKLNCEILSQEELEIILIS